MSMPTWNLLNRAIEVLHCRLGIITRKEEWSVSSGYLAGGPWVITAAHSVSNRISVSPDDMIIVRLPETRIELPAELVAIGDHECDLAILRIPSLEPPARPGTIRFGHIDRNSPSQFSDLWTIGYPRFKEKLEPTKAGGRLRESAQVIGSINPGSNVVSGLISLHVEVAPSPIMGSVHESPWQGMSGALVFSPTGTGEEPLCVGVVTEHALPEGPSTLTLTPASRLKLLQPILADDTQSAISALSINRAHEWPILKAEHPSQAVVDRLARLRSSSAATPVARRGLPVELASEIFVGRDDELDRLHSYLTNDDEHAGIRALLLSGPPGVGKTALATEASKKAKQLFNGGLIFINMHGYDQTRSVSSDQALAAVLRALGVSPLHIPATIDEKLDLYQQEATRIAAHNGPILIVMDNVAQSEQIRTLLPPAPNKLLVTSRHTHARVPGGRLIDLGVLSSSESRDLVSRVLAMTRDRDERATAEMQAVERLVNLCGYLPLALKISAALLASEPDMSVVELVEDLADERRRLEKFTYDDLAIRASFQLSYSHLTAELKHVFRSLGLHPGRHLSLESVAVLADLSEINSKSALTALRKANLIGAGALPGWTLLHDLVRIYAAERAHAECEQKQIETSLTRLTKHYYTLTADANKCIGETHSDRRTAQIRRMDRERTSIIATAESAEALNLHDQVFGLCMNIADYLRLGARASDWEGTALLAERVVGNMDEASQGRSAANLGEALWASRKFSDSLASHERAVELLRSTPDVPGLISALIGLGRAFWGLGRIQRSLEELESAVQLAEGRQDIRRLGVALAVQGNTLAENEQVEEAVRCQERAASMFDATELSHERAHVLVNLASSYWRMGRQSRTFTLLDEAAPIMLATGDLFGYALTLTSHANAAAGVGELSKAAELHRAANRMFQDIGDQYGVGRSWQNLSKVLENMGHQEEAAEYKRRSADILARYEHQHGHTISVIRLGTKPGDRWEPHAH